MNAASKGSRAERRTVAILEASGYACTRSAASRGCWDVIGVSASDVVLVQVKCNNWPSAAEMESMKEFPAPQNAKKLVHLWRDRQRLPDVKEI